MEVKVSHKSFPCQKTLTLYAHQLRSFSKDSEAIALTSLHHGRVDLQSSFSITEKFSSRNKSMPFHLAKCTREEAQFPWLWQMAHDVYLFRSLVLPSPIYNMSNEDPTFIHHFLHPRLNDQSPNDLYVFYRLSHDCYLPCKSSHSPNLCIVSQWHHLCLFVSKDLTAHQQRELHTPSIYESSYCPFQCTPQSFSNIRRIFRSVRNIDLEGCLD